MQCCVRLCEASGVSAETPQALFTATFAATFAATTGGVSALRVQRGHSSNDVRGDQQDTLTMYFLMMYLLTMYFLMMCRSGIAGYLERCC